MSAFFFSFQRSNNRDIYFCFLFPFSIFSVDCLLDRKLTNFSYKIYDWMMLSYEPHNSFCLFMFWFDFTKNSCWRKFFQTCPLFSAPFQKWDGFHALQFQQHNSIAFGGFWQLMCGDYKLLRQTKGLDWACWNELKIISEQ